MGKGLPRSMKNFLRNQDAAGSAATGVTVGGGAGGVRKEVITLDNLVIPLIDAAGVVAYAGTKILDLAEGLIRFDGAVMDLAITKSSAGVNDTWDGDVALGTVTAIGNAVLATTEQDLVPTTATPQAVAGVGTADGQSTATEIGSVFDGTTTPVDVFLNLLVDDADHDVTTTPCNLIVNGTITFNYAVLGDN